MEARQTHQLVAAVQSSPHIQSSPHTQPYIYNKRTTYTIITYTCIHTFPFLYQIFGYNRHHMCTCVFVLQFCGICSRVNRIYNRVLKNHRNTMFSGGVVLFLRLMYKKNKKTCANVWSLWCDHQQSTTDFVGSLPLPPVLCVLYL